jgi:hypothetical protein
VWVRTVERGEIIWIAIVVVIFNAHTHGRVEQLVPAIVIDGLLLEMT